ncbi:protein STPG3 [Erinaceus europaeus]|uniref:Protein STPG3 n=1 Tax=Erinaceus europaeus TaxID=9365 RepID=A0A1S2ZME9_ERIEU|nr:protein STPG3 [Erinaceus europaeus]
MNFDQKAVKFLANFYINGGKHWTHGPLKQKPLVTTQAAVRSWGLSHETVGDVMRPPRVPKLPVGLRQKLATKKEPLPVCTPRTPRELLMDQRPPILTDLDIPSPTTYQVPDKAFRESSPHPHFTIGCKPHTREGGGRRAWQTQWMQNENPFIQKTDFNQEQKWPSPVDYQPLKSPAFPAFTFGGHRPAFRTQEATDHPGVLQVGLTSGHTLPKATSPEEHPGPTTYDILPGCRLQHPQSPAFSMSHSPAFASWINYSHTPGPADYHVEDCYNSRFPSAPGVVIQGVRRPKRHDTGPFCAL